MRNIFCFSRIPCLVFSYSTFLSFQLYSRYNFDNHNHSWLRFMLHSLIVPPRTIHTINMNNNIILTVKVTQDNGAHVIFPCDKKHPQQQVLKSSTMIPYKIVQQINAIFHSIFIIHFLFPNFRFHNHTLYCLLLNISYILLSIQCRSSMILNDFWPYLRHWIQMKIW